MIFKSTLPIIEFPFKINHNEQILSIGSCFTEHIGNKLKNSFFDIIQNPFGIVYNPISIAKQLDIIIKNQLYKEEDLCHHNSKYFSWNHHSNYSDFNKGNALNKINTHLESAKKGTSNLCHLHLTFATAWVYELKSTNEIVANCHKIPSSNFVKKLLTVEEIIDSIVPVLKNYNTKFPQLKILFTLSPVRHLRDGIIEDRLSKSILRVSIDAIIKKFENAYYFPAYELVTDDLRDYRFNKVDLAHPNDMAIEYVWDYFKNALFDIKTIEIINQLDKILKMKNHIGDIHDIEFQKFQIKIKDLENQFRMEHPHIKY